MAKVTGADFVAARNLEIAEKVDLVLAETGSVIAGFGTIATVLASQIHEWPLNHQERFYRNLVEAIQISIMQIDSGNLKVEIKELN